MDYLEMSYLITKYLGILQTYFLIYNKKYLFLIC